MFYPILGFRKYKVELEVGVDGEGILFQLTNYSHLPRHSTIFRPTQSSANLMVRSIIKALEGGAEYQNFTFQTPDNVTVSGQFQQVSNGIIGTFKRLLVIVKPSVSRNAGFGTSYIVVMNDGELNKLKNFLVKAYDLKI